MQVFHLLQVYESQWPFLEGIPPSSCQLGLLHCLIITAPRHSTCPCRHTHVPSQIHMCHPTYVLGCAENAKYANVCFLLYRNLVTCSYASGTASKMKRFKQLVADAKVTNINSILPFDADGSVTVVVVEDVWLLGGFAWPTRAHSCCVVELPWRDLWCCMATSSKWTVCTSVKGSTFGLSLLSWSVDSTSCLIVWLFASPAYKKKTRQLWQCCSLAEITTTATYV